MSSFTFVYNHHLNAALQLFQQTNPAAAPQTQGGVAALIANGTTVTGTTYNNNFQGVQADGTVATKDGVQLWDWEEEATPLAKLLLGAVVLQALLIAALCLRQQDQRKASKQKRDVPIHSDPEDGGQQLRPKEPGHSEQPSYSVPWHVFVVMVVEMWWIFGLYIPVLPFFFASSEDAGGWVGLAVGAQFIGMLVGGMFWGMVGDRLGIERTILYATVVCIVGNLCSAVAPTNALFVASRILAGSGTMEALIGVYVVKLLGPVNGAACLGMMGAFCYTSLFFSSSVSGFIYEKGGQLLTFGLPGLGLMLALPILYEGLQRMPLTAEDAGEPEGVCRTLCSGEWAALAAMLIAGAFGCGCFQAGFQEHAAVYYGFNAQQLGLLNGLMFFFMATYCLGIFGKLVAKFGLEKFQAGTIGWLTVFTGVFIVGAMNPYTGILLCCICGSIWTPIPILSTIIGETLAGKYGKNCGATVVGINRSIYSVLCAIAPTPTMFLYGKSPYYAWILQWVMYLIPFCVIMQVHFGSGLCCSDDDEDDSEEDEE